ncbi:hypothetical protein FN846DRAFT_1003499, partial [Sphaerosporella brunnea]
AETDRADDKQVIPQPALETTSAPIPDLSPRAATMSRYRARNPPGELAIEHIARLSAERAMSISAHEVTADDIRVAIKYARDPIEEDMMRWSFHHYWGVTPEAYDVFADAAKQKLLQNRITAPSGGASAVHSAASPPTMDTPIRRNRKSCRPIYSKQGVRTRSPKSLRVPEGVGVAIFRFSGFRVFGFSVARPPATHLRTSKRNVNDSAEPHYIREKVSAH